MPTEMELYEYRNRNAKIMDERIERANEMLRETYPMNPGNTCLSMSEKEFLAYVRVKRAEFESKLASPGTR